MRPARSVHLGFQVEGVEDVCAVYTEVIVEQSSPNTYYCMVGFQGGYAGIQELGGGKKVIIFSLWDNASDDAHATPEHLRVQALQTAPNTDVGRFGNEGSGMRCLLPYQWREGQRCRMLLREGGGTFECFFDGGGGWFLVARLQLPPGQNAALKGMYSFVEDFGRRGYELPHAARFGPAIVYSRHNNAPSHVNKHTFTAASEKGVNINAEHLEGTFSIRLCTGGQMRQAWPLNEARTHTRLPSHLFPNHLPGTAAPLAKVAAAPEPAPAPARSVHLWYTPKSRPVAIYNEVTVHSTAEHSYFCLLGFKRGYLGVQDHGTSRKVIFSVWDSKDDNPSATPEEMRCKVLESHPETDVGRFGAEGSGARCLLDWPWRENARFRVLLRETDGCMYSCWFDGGAGWILLATILAPTGYGSTSMTGLYSFIEDFGRKGRHKPRCATFGPTFAIGARGELEEICEATFTAASEDATNIDADAQRHGFRLFSGGAIKQTTPLNAKLSRTRGAPMPLDLPGAK